MPKSKIFKILNKFLKFFQIESINDFYCVRNMKKFSMLHKNEILQFVKI